MLMPNPRSHRTIKSFKPVLKWSLWLILLVLIAMALLFAGGKLYQDWDQDADRGAIPMPTSAFGDSYSTPVYLEQGWSRSDSLWFYNTTQGSALMPYDFFLALEQAESEALFRSDAKDRKSTRLNSSHVASS